MPSFNLVSVSATGSAGSGVPTIAKSLTGVSATGGIGSFLVNSNPVGPTYHQSFSQMLYLGSRFVDPETGLLEPPWDRFLTDLWTRCGGNTSANNFAYLQIDGNLVYAVRLLDGVAVQLATV